MRAASGALLIQDEERLWTELIDKYEGSKAPWRADIVGRAYGNRGNARSRQGKMDIALVDYNRAIEICPWSVDPVLNRYATWSPFLHFYMEQVCPSLSIQPCMPLVRPLHPLLCVTNGRLRQRRLCRGVLYENTNRYSEAEQDYRCRVLSSSWSSLNV